MIDQFIDSFINEAKGLLSNLEKDLLALEADPQNGELIANIFRIMHTIKGAAAMYGFENMQNLTHEFENIYDLIRDQQVEVLPELIDLTLQGLDLLSKMLNREEVSDAAKMVIANLKDLYRHEVMPQSDVDSMEAADQSRERVVGIVFKPDKAIFERGVNPENTLEEINEAGKTHIIVHENGLSWEEQKAQKVCTAVWEVYVRTSLPVIDLENIFMFLDDDEYEVVELVDENEYLESGFTKQLADFYPLMEEMKIHILDAVKALPESDKESILSEDIEMPQQIDDKASEQKQPIKNKKVNSDVSLNVSSVKIDELLNLVSELVTSSVHLEGQAERIQDAQLMEAIENIGKLTKRFRNNALDLRLIPIRSLFMKFNRQVRDLSKELGKEVELIIEDHDTEIDKSILKSIESPLLHIIRNALDHGIEQPEEREKIGKKRKGVLKITSFYSGANVIIQIQDDGKGIDLERIREKAIEKGFIESDQRLTEQELLAIIMEPGFTTAENVSVVSGRGVGMDVVKKELNEVKGSLEIETEKGLGTYITLKLPTTLSIIDTLMVEVLGANYLLPLLEIDYCFNEKTNVLFSQKNRCLRYKDELIPFISLREKFNQPTYDREESMVVIVNKYDKKYALVVDEIVGEQQAVIKAMGELFVNQPYFSGGNILADGKIALILDTNYLFNQTVKN